MASATELMRTGQISGRQAQKLGILKKTRVQGGHMEPFENKAGRRDQGGVRDRGAAEVDVNHLLNDGLQRTGKQFLPSKGGQANMRGKFPHSEEIDEPERQKPDMPRGAGSNARPATARAFERSDGRAGQRRKDNNSKGKWSTPSRMRSRSNPENTGDQYGGRNNRRTG